MMLVVVAPLLAIVLLTVRMVEGHGMLLDPPQRSSVWRDPRFPGAFMNADDSALFCGGFDVMFSKNGGKCGICGDAFNEPHPRPNEAGGMYGQGFIVRNYVQGDVIHVTVRITANHLGYFVFKLCPNNDVEREVTQACLDKRQMKVLRSGADGREIHDDKFPIRHRMYGDIDITLKLPNDVTCSQCVLQWTYVTGHSWGCNRVGECGIGHGKQERFVNCADVAIQPNAYEQTTTTVDPSSFDINTKSYPAKKVSSRILAVSSELDRFWYATRTSSPNVKKSSSDVTVSPVDVSTTRPPRVSTTTRSDVRKTLSDANTSPSDFKTAPIVNNGQETYRDISEEFFDDKPRFLNDDSKYFSDVKTSSDAVPATVSNVKIPTWRRTTKLTSTSSTKKTTTATPVYTGDGSDCRSVGAYAGQTKVDVWCRVQCAVGYCPPTHCTCDKA
ncbi:uncharacterized protein [Littorina saxatilis]|uniref:Chitin-binding type-4 domain-containing protein n=1 Tax=Littorina saxatilis TaxID=31220 RepID=A0AAN9BL90_9CAEN